MFVCFGHANFMLLILLLWMRDYIVYHDLCCKSYILSCIKNFVVREEFASSLFYGSRTSSFMTYLSCVD